ncbi:MAG: DUF1080 domain-containing protein [Bacteroidia bacterium]|nr:DUF1080 domain-containing protein [Bacteroidia bacterium]
MNIRIFFTIILASVAFVESFTQTATVKFGEATTLNSIYSKSDNNRNPLLWFDVNTSADTWSVKKDILMSTGQPIGVMRSEKQYENFLLHIEWKHLEAGGNSGLFIWSAANPDPTNRLPDGVEVQMLELDWVNLNKRDGVTPPIAYVHGELFGVGGVKTVADNPRGERSKSIENLCKGKGEWNTYDVVCVDGVVKLSVNGKVVNGLSHATQKKGYICFESEGAPIHFRNLTLVELPPGVTSEEQTAPEIKSN